MGQITGGSYGRTVNIGDFNSKKAEIAFSVDEGEDPEIFATKAVHLCHKILHSISAGAASRSDTRPETVATGSTETAPAETLPAKPKKKAGRPPNTEGPNLDPTDARAVQEPASSATVVPATTDQPSAADAATVIEEVPTPTAPDAADPAAISEDDLLSPSVPEVTDVDLTSAITKKNAEISNPPAIRALIGEFVAPPKKATDIPQGERARFLEKLAGLQKVA